MRPEAAIRTGKAGPTAYTVTGEGEAIVLVHGVGMAREVWAPQVHALARRYKVVSYDLLGHGESDLPPEGVTLAEYADQLRALLAHLDIGAANLVGHSMGALVVLEFALAHPAHTLRVVALNAVFQRTAGQRAAVEARAAALQTEEPASSVDATLDRWFGTPVPAPLQEPAALTARLLRSVDRLGYARAYQLFARSDSVHAQRLQGLAMPALFMTGEEDHNSSPSMSAAMAQLVPDAQLMVIPGARHMMNVTHPQQVTDALVGFLERRPG